MQMMLLVILHGLLPTLRGQRRRKAAMPGLPARGRESETLARLAGAEHSQHPYVARGLIATGVRMNAIQRPISALAGQLAHTRVVADRVEARVLLQPLDRGPDRAKPADCRQPRPRLGLPAADRVEVGECLAGIDQPSWHAAAGSAAGIGRRQLVVGAKAVDPGVNLLLRHRPAGSDVGVGRCYHRGLTGDPASPVGFGLVVFGNGFWARHGRSITHGGLGG